MIFKVLLKSFCAIPYFTYSIHTKCHLSPRSIYMGTGIVHVITDFMLLLFPLLLIWKLDMSKPQKLCLIAVFALGSLYVKYSHAIFPNFSVTPFALQSRKDDHADQNFRLQRHARLYGFRDILYYNLYLCKPKCRFEHDLRLDQH